MRFYALACMWMCRCECVWSVARKSRDISRPKRHNNTDKAGRASQLGNQVARPAAINLTAVSFFSVFHFIWLHCFCYFRHSFGYRKFKLKHIRFVTHSYIPAATHSGRPVVTAPQPPTYVVWPLLVCIFTITHTHTHTQERALPRGKKRKQVNSLVRFHYFHL